MQPQYPPMPQYPAAPAYPYPPQPVYPPQQYAAAPQYPAAPAPTVAGSLDAFFEQPSGANKAWVFKDRPIGTAYSGIVARPITDSDIRQQTDNSNNPQRYKDGRPKFVMVVPMLVQPSAEFPEGQASWWVKGQARDELARAMAEAGAPVGPPEAGAAITVQLVGQRPIPNMNPAYQYRITYMRPSGMRPQGASESITPVTQAQPHPSSPMAQPWAQPVPPMSAMPAPVAPTFVAQPAPQPVAQAVPQAAPVTLPPEVANGLSPEQQALLAKLTGAQG